MDTDQIPGRKTNVVHEDTKPKACQPCYTQGKNSAAAVFCQSCNEFQCIDCSQIHTAYAFMENHQLIDAKEDKIKHVFDMKGFDHCDQHQELLKFYCEDDKILCCSDCAIVNHRKCESVVQINSISESVSSSCPELKPKLQRIKAKAETVVEDIQTEVKDLRQDVKDIYMQVQRVHDDINKSFEDLDSSSIKDAEEILKDVFEKLKQTRTTCENILDDINGCITEVDFVGDTGTVFQQLKVEHRIKKQIREHHKTINEVYQDLEHVTMSLDFNKAIKMLSVEISPRKPGLLTLKYSLPDDTRKEKTIELEMLATTHLKHHFKGNFHFTGLDFLSDNRLVAADNYNKACIILDDQLRIVGSCKLLRIPQSVVAVSENEVAITSSNEYKIDFFRVTKSNKITFIRTFTVTKEYTSICLWDSGHFVVGTINDETPVRIVSHSGEEVDLGINFQNEKYALGQIACTSIKDKDKIILTDRIDHTVYLYDTKVNARVVVKDHKIKEPRGVAIGPSDCILVCSEDTHSIVQISATGRIQASFKLDMKYPFRVAVSLDKTRLAVANNCAGDRKLQLFVFTN